MRLSHPGPQCDARLRNRLNAFLLDNFYGRIQNALSNGDCGIHYLGLHARWTVTARFLARKSRIDHAKVLRCRVAASSRRFFFVGLIRLAPEGAEINAHRHPRRYGGRSELARDDRAVERSEGSGRIRGAKGAQ
jgi:hypothetical protein